LAEGGAMNMLGKLTTDGKIVTHGILFDTGNATLKPQSMGVLNELAKTLKENAALKIEIDGHTDTDGNAQLNMKLSQDRAEAVKRQLVSMGIDGARLTTKGLGSTKPIDNNTTPEGKANNRRVELVKVG
jgi:outer membrane protein OmpA-like peptidoglycan-associated protein